MGYGEEYWLAFDEWFNRKTTEQKRAYAADHPEPEGWDGFYRRKGIEP